MENNMSKLKLHEEIKELQSLREKLNDALSKAYVDMDNLQQRHNDAVVSIAKQEVIIQYLESKFK